MKTLLFVAALAFCSCHKADQPTPSYSIQNTSWTEITDNNFHISFTSSSILFQSATLTPNPSAFLCSFSNDTVFVPQIEQSFVFKISKDSLIFSNTKVPESSYHMFRQ